MTIYIKNLLESISTMKLVQDSKLQGYSIWLDDDNNSRHHSSVYSIVGDLDFKLLFKLNALKGPLYLQHDLERWSVRFNNHDRLYRLFVDNKK